MCGPRRDVSEVIREPPRTSLEPLDHVEQDGPFLPPLDELFDVGLFESQVTGVAEDPTVFGVSQGTIRAWGEARKIPMTRNPVNGYRLFRREDLERFLKRIDEQCRKPRADRG